MPATVCSFYVSVLYTTMLRTSIAAVVLGCFYSCPLDCDASVMVGDCAAVETGCMLEKYIPAKGCNKIRAHFYFLVEVLLLLLLLRAAAAAAAHNISTEAERGTGYCFLLLRPATTTAVSFASILLLLLRLRRDACRKKQTKNITFSFLVAALLLLFTHREGCAENN